jgi:hypothetical protein
MDLVAQIVLSLVNLGVSIANLAMLAFIVSKQVSPKPVETGLVSRPKRKGFADSPKRVPIAADDYRAYRHEQDEIKKRTPL